MKELKTAVVTGGTRGIGQAVSKELIENGHKVYALYRSQTEEALKFKSSLGELSSRCEVRKVDATSVEDVDAFWTQFESDEERLDVLVNNCGIRRDQLLASMSLEDWNLVLQTNLTSAFMNSQKAVLLMMKKRFGRIINMGSVGAKAAFAGQANYAASKAALTAMTKALSKEVAKRKITVNCVCPGFIETELINDLPEEQMKEYVSQIPMKRIGQTHEVAHAVSFLASDKASYITGTTLDVAGGLG